MSLNYGIDCKSYYPYLYYFFIIIDYYLIYLKLSIIIIIFLYNLIYITFNSNNIRKILLYKFWLYEKILDYKLTLLDFVYLLVYEKIFLHINSLNGIYF